MIQIPEDSNVLKCHTNIATTQITNASTNSTTIPVTNTTTATAIPNVFILNTQHKDREACVVREETYMSVLKKTKDDDQITS